MTSPIAKPSWAEIKRAAVEAAAIQVITDRTQPPDTRAAAKRALVERVDVGPLSDLQLRTLRALLRAAVGEPLADVELRVVGEPVRPCDACCRRKQRHYLDLTDFDPATRAAIQSAVDDAPAILKEPDRDDQDDDEEEDSSTLAALDEPRVDRDGARAGAEAGAAAIAEAPRGLEPGPVGGVGDNDPGET